MTTFAFTDLPLADSWNMHGGSGWAWMAPMMIGMALFWGAIILGFVWLIRDGVDHRQARRQETALTILDRRFAEGTLSHADYQQRKNVLTSTKAQRADKTVSAPASEDIQR